MDVAFLPLPLPHRVSQLHVSFRVPFILPLFPGEALPGLQELGLESPQLITPNFSVCFSISFPQEDGYTGVFLLESSQWAAPDR